MVAFDSFYARPKEIEGSGLIAHSLKTAKGAREIASSIGLGDPAFYAGLLHDVGKLNPYYQELFSSDPSSRENVKIGVDRNYVRAHAIFSALAAYGLSNNEVLTRQGWMQVLFAVSGHHSKLTQFYKSLEYCNKDKRRFDKSFEGVGVNLQRFIQEVSALEDFRGLDWDLCLKRFKRLSKPQNEDGFEAENKVVAPMDFLDFSAVYSALILADRGSFFDWKNPAFNINFDTSVLVKSGYLSALRGAFQEKVLSQNEFEDRLMVLKAPTGIGKTKIFLDIVNRLSQKRVFERVFYFSPLLALTEDFEAKLFGKNEVEAVLKQKDLEKVLIYNHAFVGSLLKKTSGVVSDEEEAGFRKTREYFEVESFNRELIVSTTQRLLMVLYSNEPADKEKLLAFKNSFLIIDEVQTIPKFLLPNLLSLFRVLVDKYNSTILLVSATVPQEVNGLPMLNTPDEVKDNYLRLTSKRIEFKAGFDVSLEVPVLGSDERVLFMVNTRRKACKLYEDISRLKSDVVYLSSGIKKCARKKAVEDLHSSGTATVVSTQVMEAGVDVSFTRMYREVAPLDNIVQAMGRLSREGEVAEPVLTVFDLDDDYRPYSELEMNLSKRLIPQLHSSVDLYERLPEYYRKVSESNKLNSKLADELSSSMKRLEFEDVWAFIKSHVLPVELGDSVFIPDLSEWDEVKSRFLSSGSFDSKGALYKRFSGFMAELPGTVEGLKLMDQFDDDLFNIGVLLPKKECVSKVYDPVIGLDKWVKARE
ncbi:MAG: CRISPR-associated helicase Cas3' [Candidatus Bathyarchaeia archaeon]